MFVVQPQLFEMNHEDMHAVRENLGLGSNDTITNFSHIDIGDGKISMECGNQEGWVSTTVKENILHTLVDELDLDNLDRFAVMSSSSSGPDELDMFFESGFENIQLFDTPTTPLPTTPATTSTTPPPSTTISTSNPPVISTLPTTLNHQISGSTSLKHPVNDTEKFVSLKRKHDFAFVDKMPSPIKDEPNVAHMSLLEIAGGIDDDASSGDDLTTTISQNLQLLNSEVELIIATRKKISRLENIVMKKLEVVMYDQEKRRKIMNHFINSSSQLESLYNEL